MTVYVSVRLDRTELDAKHSGGAENTDLAEHEENPAGSPHFSNVITMDSLYSGAIDWSTCSISSEDHFCEHREEKQHNGQSDSPNLGMSEEILPPLGRLTCSKTMTALPGRLTCSKTMTALPEPRYHLVGGLQP